MKNLRYALLGAVLLFISTGSVAFANVTVNPSAPTDPQPFTVSCGPYDEPFVSGNYYMPAEDGDCAYTLPTSGQEVEFAIYEGTPGNSTIIDSDFGYSGEATSVLVGPEDFNPFFIQGQDYFAVEYAVGTTGNSPLTDLNNTNNYLSSGGTAPDGVIINMVQWKYGTAPVTQSPLTVTADNQTAELGSAFPAFTSTLSGFVAPDTATSSDVTGAASCTTTATVSSVPGSYPITCTVGTLVSAANYTFGTFTPGTLTIVDTTAPAVTITSPINGQSYLTNASITPSATVSDLSPVTATTYTFNGAAVSATAPLVLPMVTATTSETLVVAAIDAFGNTGYATSTFMLSPVPAAPAADHTPPVITITSPIDGGLYAKTDTTVHIIATITDQSAIAATTYWFNGVKVNPANALSLSNAPVVSKIVVVSSDIFGNTATSTATIYVVKSVNSCLIDIISVLTAIVQDKTLPTKPTILNLIADCSALLKGKHHY